MAGKYNVSTRARTYVHRNVIGLVRLYYNKVWGTRIGEGTRISLSAKIDLTNPSGVIIGKNSALAFDAAILTHDFVNGIHRETRVGDCCFIGARAIIMPGVTVGNHCIVGTGTIVFRDVPPHSVVMGNPGRVIERGIRTGEFGRRLDTPQRAAQEADEKGRAGTPSVVELD